MTREVPFLPCSTHVRPIAPIAMVGDCHRHIAIPGLGQDVLGGPSWNTDGDLFYLWGILRWIYLHHWMIIGYLQDITCFKHPNMRLSTLSHVSNMFQSHCKRSECSPSHWSKPGLRSTCPLEVMVEWQLCGKPNAICTIPESSPFCYGSYKPSPNGRLIIGCPTFIHDNS